MTRKYICLLFLSIILTYSPIILGQDITPPETPQSVQGFRYEKHIDVDWIENSETDLYGYKIYKSTGGAFTFYLNVPKSQSYLYLYIGSATLTYYFKVSAYDSSGNESPLSDSVECAPHPMTDEEFLDMTQRATFRYFYDYAHPVSGLSRERLGSGEIVTSGGSGFGIMALLVGIERGYISRDQGVTRMLKIANFLQNTADKFHGVFSHWLNGTTGAVIPFSTYDNGGDLVETAYLIQGLLTARQYFDQSNANEEQIRNLVTQIWQGVEWSWYRRFSTSNFLFWHWSPNYGWQMNMTVQGPNEAMIVYLLAIASTTYGVPASLFHNGWASSSNYTNTNSFYGYRIWVGWNYGGPLFFQHYSLLGFDPRNIKDAYCNYYSNAKNISLIHREYSIANPHGFTGYNANCWGLTASDDPSGYRVHEPTNDNGTITPSAALSSMPYTPQESLEALKYFYRTYGSQVWGEYGFKDAFNDHVSWYANSYLAIDQGPIIIMIENYRSQLLWNKFMANPEIQPMLDSIGFVPDSVTSIHNDIQSVEDFKLLGNYPNPFNPSTTIVFNLAKRESVSIEILNLLGEKVNEIFNGEMLPGRNEVTWNGLNAENKNVSSGIYIYRINAADKIISGKMVLQK
ncbi:MAG: T9SS type A sorting domain-containing protein [Ignavibacteriaceae bacterium]|nr:T9SS type A sorting domain-containing protein [Ignavibacterium sp.]MCC6255442.1 T9SS type A sorting domain-containing protein [Ignavibacteriaceae bacterium]HMN23349.1 glucoamylase family protein [Ignavibacteriaceae bacterium]HRN26726.1 glucoamylase family protein [Ignavibacteriaceae bacterium]HRP93005.1 glucoamylase family protein [Ignavibacteriaceae bacterium]